MNCTPDKDAIGECWGTDWYAGAIASKASNLVLSIKVSILEIGDGNWAGSAVSSLLCVEWVRGAIACPGISVSCCN
ncbi:MAG: hypothetical protein ACFE0J_25940 [Elainellaceae cyanobacterium]